MNPQFLYILNCFRKLYQLPPEIEIGHGTQNKKVNIAFGNCDYFQSLKTYPLEKVIWKEWKNQKIPLLFDVDPNLPVLEQKDYKIFINYDIIASAFFFLSGWQEYVFMKNNPVFRFPFSESLQGKLNINKIPIVNYYFDILKEAIESVYNIQLNYKLFSKPIICLTHDIDRTNSGWKEGGLSEFRKGHFLSPLKLFAKRFLTKDVWFNFDEILALEEKYNANSSFYFLPKKGKSSHQKIVDQISESFTNHFLCNADYDISNKSFQDVLIKIQEAGSEVALHGSFGSHLDLDILQNDIEKLGMPIVGGRFHNLLFDMSKTFNLLERVGLKYDSTLGFAEEIGFRNGIAFPFHPYNFEKKAPNNVIEIPLIVMDTTFRVYKKLSPDQAFLDMQNLSAEVKKFAGVFTILWHNNYFSPFKFAGWKEVYEDFLEFAQNNGFELLSGKEVYSLFSSD